MFENIKRLCSLEFFLHKENQNEPLSDKGQEQGADFYDKKFFDNNHWCDHYTESRYYSLWSIIVDRFCRSSGENVLDIGCGPGQVANFLKDKGCERYLGIDFSSARIKQAQSVCPEFDFLEADIFETTIFDKFSYDTVICLEFLEHVEKDLEVIQKLRNGTHFLGSVPNIQIKQHVRYFNNIEEVELRYADFFDEFIVDEHLANSSGTKYFLIEGVVRSN